MKKIELKGLCNEVEITLNNLMNCRVEERDGSVSVVFDTAGMSVEPGETDPTDSPTPDTADG